MTDAFRKVIINPNNFEDRKVNERVVELEIKKEFLEKWMKLLKCNATEKERHIFLLQRMVLYLYNMSIYILNAVMMQLKLVKLLKKTSSINTT